ncbi:MAG: hypothetical protein CL878_03625 [Dehalococcoidia bacterium]|nr:hypothetical protein [Dehalococcoidia bacterium]
MTSTDERRKHTDRRANSRDRRQRPGTGPRGKERRIRRVRRRQVHRLADLGALSHAELLRRWSEVLVELGSIRQWQREALESLGQEGGRAETERVQAEHAELDERCAFLYGLAVGLATRVEELAEQAE